MIERLRADGADIRRVVNRARRWTITTGTSLLSRGYDERRTIVLTGSPRSGTTWVASLFGAIPGAAVLFEPLHLNEVPGAARVGFTWRTYVDPSADWPEGEAFMRRIVQGRLLTPWTSREITSIRRVTTWVVKFVRANRLLPWIAERFPPRRRVLLIRHPCAVVASRLAKGWSTGLGAPDDDHPFGVDVGRYTASLRYHDERVTAQWALDVLVPLTRPQPWPWEVVWFERLVEEGESYMRKTFDRWNTPMPDDIPRLLQQWSSTTRRSSRGADALTAWQRELSSAQIERILKVAHRLGVTSYSDSPQPVEQERYSPPSV